jgi:hypothetical protein
MVALQSVVLTTLRCIEGPNLWENADRQVNNMYSGKLFGK